MPVGTSRSRPRTACRRRARSAARRTAVLALLAAGLALTPLPGAGQEQETSQAPRVLLLEIDDTVTAGTAAYVIDRVRGAPEAGYAAVVIRLDTPGGLVDATLKMLQAVSESPVPVITYVGPSGAIAASAGSFLLVSGHVAAMAPGTTTGAAMPVTIDPTGGGQPRSAGEKTIKFLAGHMRSIARERGRPADVVARFVTDNLTLDARQALDEGVVDLVAADLDDVLERADGRTVETAAREVTLRTAGARLVAPGMSPGEQLQHMVSNPQFAFLLLIGGAYALYVGFAMPGTLIPETLGGILVLLGLFGLGLFDTNLAGLLLLGLGFVFLVVELFTPTYGVLTAAGLAGIVLGALLFPAEPLLPGSWFASFRNLVLALAATLAVLTTLVLVALVRSRRRLAREGAPGELPARGLTVDRLDPGGRVRLRGELWRGRSWDGGPIEPDSEVEVVGREGLTVYVRKPKDVKDAKGVEG